MNKYSLLTIGIVLLVAGCSTNNLNTGAVDYRLIDAYEKPTSRLKSETPNKAEDTTNQKAVDENSSLLGRYVKESALEKLTILQPNDAVSIRLMQAHICDFSEYSFRETFKYLKPSSYRATPCKHLGNSFADTRGEIAIVVDAFEQGDKRIEFQTGTLDAERGRVVYYSEDVRETGQVLNLSNIPIYGPITYTGKPLFLRLTIVELDDIENSQLSATIKSLAGLGSKAYAPGSEILDVLNGLGQALLSGSQDDLEFDYVMTFDGFGGLSASHAPLAVGVYAFVRIDNRSHPFEWGHVELNSDDGRLYCSDAALSLGVQGCWDKEGKIVKSTEAPVEYRGQTYLTVKITKNEAAIENESVQLLSEFKAKAEQDIQANNFDDLSTYATVLDKRAKMEALFDTARAQIDVIQSRALNDLECKLALEGFAEGLCSVLLFDTANESTNADPDMLRSGQEKARYLLAGLYRASLSAESRSCEIASTDTRRVADDFSLTKVKNDCRSAKESENIDYIEVWKSITTTDGEETVKKSV